jgi:hypothetical protein
MFNKTSKYEAELDESLMSFISSSLGYIESTYTWNRSLLIDNTPSIYLNVEMKVTANVELMKPDMLSASYGRFGGQQPGLKTARS